MSRHITESGAKTPDAMSIWELLGGTRNGDGGRTYHIAEWHRRLTALSKRHQPVIHESSRPGVAVGRVDVGCACGGPWLCPDALILQGQFGGTSWDDIVVPK